MLLNGLTNLCQKLKYIDLNQTNIGCNSLSYIQKLPNIQKVQINMCESIEDKDFEEFIKENFEF